MIIYKVQLVKELSLLEATTVLTVFTIDRGQICDIHSYFQTRCLRLEAPLLGSLNSDY